MQQPTQYIALADQRNAQIRVVRHDSPNWDDTPHWLWYPTPESGCFDSEKFKNVSDIKLRDSHVYGGLVVLTCASVGFAGIIRYPSGEPVWTLKDSDLINPHAVELLPNGNLLVASSQGNSVRLYAASQGIGCAYVQVFLEDAHGLLYDPQRDIIWALGGHELCAYRAGGTATAPTLEEVPGTRTPLPTLSGHDLQPVYGEPDRMWVSAGGVHQFDKNKCAFVSYPGEAIISAAHVKSIGNQPYTGDIVRCRPNGTMYDWNTNTVDLFIKNGDTYQPQTRVSQNGAFYKARVFCHHYC